MAELKTKKTEFSIDAFINKIPDAQKRNDALTIIELIEKATKAKGKVWGSSIIGFGDRHLKYESGRELDWFVMGFSRANKIWFYIFPERSRSSKHF